MIQFPGRIRLTRVSTMFCKFLGRPSIAAVVILSICAGGLGVFPQDIVAADDITGGASVFVFRESRKKPQKMSGNRGFRQAGGRTRSGGAARIQLAANRKRRAERVKSNTELAAKSRARRRGTQKTRTAALLAKAESKLEANSFDEASAGYREALKLDPKNSDAARGLSEALTSKAVELDSADAKSVAAMLEEAVKLDARNDAAYIRLGDLYQAENDNAKALASYEKAVQINPDFAAAYVPLGTSYLAAGEIAKAEAASRTAERLGVNNAEAQNLKGMILFRQNKNAEALQVFDAVLKAEGRNATARYYQALVFDRMNQPDQSLTAFREAVAEDPAYTQAWFDLGVAYYNKGEYGKAAESYQQVVKYDDGNAQAHANLASTYRQLERYPDANAEYRLAEENGMNNNPDFYSEWGYSLGKNAEWDKSVAKLETAQKISPAAIDDNNVGWGYYNAAQAEKASKNDAAATEKLQKGKVSLQAAVQKDSKLEAAYLNLGSTNNALGDFQAAVAALNLALALRGDWVIAINQLGVGYRGMNNLTTAIEQFRRVTTLDANNVFGLYNLGEAYTASGNKKEAKRVQDRLRKLNPEMAGRLENIISGKTIIDETKRKIQQKIPKIPRIPF